MINKPTQKTHATSVYKYETFLPKFDILFFLAFFYLMIQTLSKLHEELF